MIVIIMMMMMVMMMMMIIILVTAELPILCNIYFFYLLTLFSNHFAMSVFIFEVFIYKTV